MSSVPSRTSGGNGDEYILHGYPVDNNASMKWSTSYSNIGARDYWDSASNTAHIADPGGANTIVPSAGTYFVIFTPATLAFSFDPG